MHRCHRQFSGTRSTHPAENFRMNEALIANGTFYVFELGPRTPDNLVLICGFIDIKIQNQVQNLFPAFFGLRHKLDVVILNQVACAFRAIGMEKSTPL